MTVSLALLRILYVIVSMHPADRARASGALFSTSMRHVHLPKERRTSRRPIDLLKPPQLSRHVMTAPALNLNAIPLVAVVEVEGSAASFVEQLEVVAVTCRLPDLVLDLFRGEILAPALDRCAIACAAVVEV
jgi:hypothetical protein